MSKTLLRDIGWRASKGPRVANESGFRASGHRLLLREMAVVEETVGGIILAQKTIDKEKLANTIAVVVEIGFDAWADKSTDYCEVGDKVLVGQYSGKMQVSTRDGHTYRFISDLDIISTIEE